MPKEFYVAVMVISVPILFGTLRYISPVVTEHLEQEKKRIATWLKDILIKSNNNNFDWWSRLIREMFIVSSNRLVLHVCIRAGTYSFFLAAISFAISYCVIIPPIWDTLLTIFVALAFLPFIISFCLLLNWWLKKVIKIKT